MKTLLKKNKEKTIVNLSLDVPLVREMKSASDYLGVDLSSAFRMAGREFLRKRGRFNKPDAHPDRAE